MKFEILILLSFISFNCNSQNLGNKEGISIIHQYRDTCIGKELGGKKHGLWQCMNNGELTEIEYSNGILNGLYRVYHPNSNVVEREFFFVDGLEEGMKRFYSEDGMLLQTNTYQRNFLVSKTEFYPSGGVKTFGTYIKDTVETEVISFDIDTKEEKVSLIKETVPEKNGSWFYYLENGLLNKIEKYNRGKLVE